MNKQELLCKLSAMIFDAGTEIDYCDKFLKSAYKEKNDGTIVLMMEFARSSTLAKKTAYEKCEELVEQLEEGANQ